jgi:hypothetical protein
MILTGHLRRLQPTKHCSGCYVFISLCSLNERLDSSRERSPCSSAVNAFGLVGTDDDIGKRGAVLENENGVRLARLRLALADLGYSYAVRS